MARNGFIGQIETEKTLGKVTAYKCLACGDTVLVDAAETAYERMLAMSRARGAAIRHRTRCKLKVAEPPLNQEKP